MKRRKNEEISEANSKDKFKIIYNVINNLKNSFNKKYFLIFIKLIGILIANDIILVNNLNKNSYLNINKEIQTNHNCLIKSNLDLDHEFITMKSVQD